MMNPELRKLAVQDHIEQARAAAAALGHSPERRFASRAEAATVAAEITAMPRKGVAHPLSYGYFDAWLVEIRPRDDRYGNPRVLREDGTAVGYFEWAPSFRPIRIFDAPVAP